VTVTSERAERIDFYRRYIDCCNQHRFEELGEFVAEDVRGGDGKEGLERYIAGCQAVVDAFPDYRWDLQHLLVDGDWLAARLVDTGTHSGTFRGVPATGRVITVQELAVYRLENGRIAEGWGDLGSAVRDLLTNGG
jgi:steroid delta-isomerase-like uncharacterized protein